MVVAILILISVFLLVIASTSLPFVIGSASVLSFILSGKESFLAIFPQRMYSQVNMFVLLALPMFILTGEIMGRTKVASVLIDFALSVFGRFKGGLGHVNIMTSIFFAGVSGSQFADTAMLSNVLVPQMKKRGYPGAYAAAITSTSSVVGPVIPPSTILILFGALFQLSIGALFIAGIIPGLLLGLMMMITNSIIAKRKNHPGGTAEDCPPFWQSLFRALPALSLPVIIVGGIVFGVVTPTEAGAIAVLAALGCGYLYGGITWRSLIEGVEKTVVMTGAIFGVLAALSLFNWLAAFLRIPNMISEWINAMGLVGYKYLIAIVIVFIISGMIADLGVSLFLLAPLLVPEAVAQGFHPIHVGIVVVITMVIGGSTPPVGGLLVVATAIANESYWKTSIAAFPLVLGQFAIVFVLIFLPDIVLLLPKLMGML
jgi:tripartite ATP-independent transporter DctM subunit